MVSSTLIVVDTLVLIVLTGTSRFASATHAGRSPPEVLWIWSFQPSGPGTLTLEWTFKCPVASTAAVRPAVR